MTTKENVLNIYPKAELTCIGNNKVFCLRSPHSTSKLLTWTNIIGTGSTEEKAWESAWKIIQNDMLTKLES
jgi:hypothetical protein